MNPQPEFATSWAVAIAWLFIVYIFFCNKENHYKLSDKFTLATIEDEPDIPKPKKKSKTKKTKTKKKKNKVSKPKSTPKHKPKPKNANINAARKPSTPPAPKRNHNGYTQLQQDCFDSLKSLGVKGVRERKFIVSNTFNKHNPSTVQEFLKKSLHRGI